MIKFVYFDVGGVLIKDFSATSKWEDLKYSIGVRPENEKKFMEVWMKYRDRICIDYDINDKISELINEVGLSIPPHYSFLHGFTDKFEKNESIWNIVEKMKKSIRIGLLTNMYVGMLDVIIEKEIVPPVQWDVIVDSSKVKAQKPDVKIFEIAQEKAGVLTEEILFIDNKEKHVNAAKQLGWQTFLYDSSNYEKSSNELGIFLNHVGIL